MPSNKRESFVYTIMMCFVMVFWMSLYNIYLHAGTFSLEVFKTAWLGLPLGYCCALILDWFVVSTTAKKVAFKLLVLYVKFLPFQAVWFYRWSSSCHFTARSKC